MGSTFPRLAAAALAALVVPTALAQQIIKPGDKPPKGMRVVPLDQGKPEDPAKLNPEYKAELLKLMGADQAIRKRAEALGITDGLPMPPAFSQEWHENDRANLARLRELINKYGWPDTSAVGQAAAMGAFLVIQHADAATQRELLPKMEDAVARGEASGHNLAYLVDRVRIGQGQKQVYGTQIDHDQAGNPIAMNLEDPEHVDERRAKVGMPPLQAYLDMFRDHKNNAGAEPAAAGAPGKIDEALHTELLKLKTDEIALASRLSAAGYPFPMVPPEPLKSEKDKLESQAAARIKDIIQKHGWPGNSLVGKDGAQVIFINFRRLDKDFRAKTLPDIEKASKAGEFSPKLYAFLADETRIAQGQKQLYGTQFRKTESGQVEPEPIDNPDQVEVRRAELGLPSLADTVKILNDHSSQPASEEIQYKRIEKK